MAQSFPGLKKCLAPRQAIAGEPKFCLVGVNGHVKHQRVSPPQLRFATITETNTQTNDTCAGAGSQQDGFGSQGEESGCTKRGRSDHVPEPIGDLNAEK